MNPIDPDVAAALASIDRMMRKVPYEAIVESLDACMQMPGGPAMEGAIVMRRLAIAQVYGRGDEEIADILSQAQPILRQSEGVADWVLSVCAPCMQRPNIAPRFVPQALAELRAHLDQHPDPVGEEIYRDLRQEFERTIAGT